MPEDLQASAAQERIHFSSQPFEAEMRALVVGGLYLDQDAVYHRLSTALTVDDVVDKTRDDFGAETSKTMVETVEANFGNDYVRLLVEPSVSTRLDEFIPFARDALTNNSNLTPWDVRNGFKEHLGTKATYRVVSATPHDLDNIIQTGFVANYYRHRSPEVLLANTDGYESMEYALSDLRGRVSVHAGAFANTSDSTLISVSEYPGMAQYAATVQLQGALAEIQASGSRLYMLPMVVDEFSLIRYGKYLPRSIQGDGIWTDGDVEIPYGDPGVEAWVEFRIPASAIRRDQIRELDPSDIPQFRFAPRAVETT